MIYQSISAVTILIFFIPKAANTAEIHNKHENRSELNTIANPCFFSRNITDEKIIYFILDFKGKTKINDYLIRYGQLESNLSDIYLDDPSKSQNSDEDHSINSLKVSNYNSFSCNSILCDSSNYIDILPIFDKVTIHNRNLFLDYVNFAEDHRNINFFSLINGLNFSIQYLKSKKIKHRINTDKLKTLSPNMCYFNRSDFDIFLTYKFNNLFINGSYSINGRKSILQSHSDKSKQWAVNLKYDVKNTYLEIIYNKTSNTPSIRINNKNEIQSIFLVAQYQFDSCFRPSIAYFRSKEIDIELNTNRDLKKYFLVGITYYFNKSMLVNIDYKINQINRNKKLSIDSDSISATISIVY